MSNALLAGVFRRLLAAGYYSITGRRIEVSGVVADLTSEEFDVLWEVMDEVDATGSDLFSITQPSSEAQP
jgi:hypothetical protein